MKRKTIISVRNLTYSFNDLENVLEDVSFSINKGDLVAIIGSNGTGKSTLVKIISGLLRAKKSSVKVNGKLAYIPQNFNQDFNFPAKVKEILDLECCDCSLRTDVLKSLGISNFENRQFKNLSGGQAQRVIIALSLLSNPDILILDEPTVGVDTKTQEDFYKLLKKLNKEKNLTILFITHDTGIISSYFTKIICIHDKKVFVDDAKNIRSLLHSTYGGSFQELSHKHHNHRHRGSG